MKSKKYIFFDRKIRICLVFDLCKKNGLPIIYYRIMGSKNDHNWSIKERISALELNLRVC